MDSKELRTVLHNCFATIVGLFMFGLMKGGVDGCCLMVMHYIH